VPPPAGTPAAPAAPLPLSIVAEALPAATRRAPAAPEAAGLDMPEPAAPEAAAPLPGPRPIAARAAAPHPIRDGAAAPPPRPAATTPQPTPTPPEARLAPELPPGSPPPTAAAPPPGMAPTPPAEAVAVPPPPAPTLAPVAVTRSEAAPPQPPHRLPMSEAAQQVAQHAVTAAADGVESISVDLRPPELGRVELRLTFQDGTVQVAMAAERSDAFEALRQDRASLEQQMQQAGLQLGTGGLDLQHGRLPRPAPEAAVTPRWTAGAAEPAEEADAARPPRSDSLIDLIA
jgi:hypothetical protein